MEFRKYQHIERYGTAEVQGIENGTCYVFPKIDGTNASVWINDEGEICAGSRNRQLSIDKDNAGFLNSIIEDNNIKRYLMTHPTHRLYWEWLVPHSLKTYRDDAWRKFYIFDVVVDDSTNTNGVSYINYDKYVPLLEEYGLNYIPLLKKIVNGTYKLFSDLLKENKYLIETGKGIGEGVVIKNYNFINKYGRQTWAKLVSKSFQYGKKEIVNNHNVVLESDLIEEKIVEEFITPSFVKKRIFQTCYIGKWMEFKYDSKVIANYLV